ncbi:MAG: lipid-A-disaccharide synthase [Planctomycetales bacterium]|nr:lipid-A-disaccharide synthase [Planctomycetales bacterium]
MKIFFSVGEPSGDLHGANLIRALRTRHAAIECVGYGGPEMASAGCQLHEDLTKLAVMWLLNVILHLHKFWALVSRADRYFRHNRPDAVVLIDYPGFNWWIARRAKAHGIPVFYYGTPQIWGWARWRVKKLRRLVDHALCKLPFEPQWYSERGCNATYIGHPFFDEVRRHQFDEDFLKEQQSDVPLVAILPGSRTQEVKANLPSLLKAAQRVHEKHARVRFAIAAFRPAHAELAWQMLAEASLPSEIAIDVHIRRTPELIHLAHCTMSVSGSVSLELLYHKKPTVILYQISPLANLIQQFMRKVEYITLVNLLMHERLRPRKPGNYDPDRPGAEEVLFPEYLTCADRSDDIARHVTNWLANPPERRRKIEQLAQLRERIASGGASGRGADYILEALLRKPASPPRPHLSGYQLANAGRAA